MSIYINKRSTCHSQNYYFSVKSGHNEILFNTFPNGNHYAGAQGTNDVVYRVGGGHPPLIGLVEFRRSAHAGGSGLSSHL